MRSRASIAGALLAVLSFGTLAAAPDPVAVRRDADRLKGKISAIAQRAEVEEQTSGAARTTVTESELNGYLALEVADDLPVGVVSPTINMLGNGRASGRAVVDLDRVRSNLGATSVLNPLSYLRGRLPVVATGTLHTGNGVAQLRLESATVAGVPVPKLVLQQIVTHYSRSEHFPSGIDLDEPMPLPARIREIHVERGQAVVVQ
jgi:hypothetical protein